MNVLFRTDASEAIGTGHVMRCLALAEALGHRGVASTFLCRSLPAALAARIGAEGHSLAQLDAGPGWQDDADVTALTLSAGQALIVDHYGLGHEWEGALRSKASLLLAIDDAPTRAHDCDILLDQNLHHDATARYGVMAPKSRLLLGPGFALLRQEFAAARRRVTARTSARRLFVSFGGSDPTDEATKAHAALQSMAGGKKPDVDIVLGPAYMGQLAALPQHGQGIRILSNPDDFIERMAAADLALGAGGVSSWERCCLGLPALCIAVAPNQEAVAEACDAAGVLHYLGVASSVSVDHLTEAIQRLRNAPTELAAMSNKALALVDGEGANRVADTIHGILTGRRK